MDLYRTPFILPLLFPKLVWRMPESGRILYLTFDDGPVPGPTEFVLETLSTYGVKATFFCIGDNVRKHPDIFRKVVERGHSIGNHTFNHLNGWKTPVKEYEKNVRECSSRIEKETGISPVMFRPPYGKISRAQVRSLSEFRIVMWDVLTYDFEARITPEACHSNSVRATREGSIVIFHDSYKAERNMRYVLPRYVEHFLEEGYTFSPLSL